MGITFLHRSEINDEKWDRVIAGSRAETIYPYSWYLDRVADRWSALVMGDYHYLMPLVWKRRWGIAYLYQPYYTQQLGIFGEDYTEPTLIKEFIGKIPGKFRKAHIQFNAQNLVSHQPAVHVSDRKNYILRLDGDYNRIASLFSNNARRNLKKAELEAILIDKNLTCSELVEFKKRNDTISRSEREYRWLAELLESLIKRGAGVIYSAGKGEQLNAAAFFAFSETRAIYLVSASDQSGKDQRSMFRIVDTFIREHAGSGMILDFEGSNIPSVARFFSGFGAVPEIYQAVGFRRFPFTITGN